MLDIALKIYQPLPGGQGRTTYIRAAPPRETRFSLYRLDIKQATATTSPFIFQHNMQWQTISLYPIHVFELLTCGETEVSIAARSGDDPWLKENEYICIEPQEHPLRINLDMTGITGGALGYISSAIDAMEKRRGIKAPKNATSNSSKEEVSKGITTQQVADAFQELHYGSKRKWKKYLGDPPRWLEKWRLAKGIKGSRKESGIWDPVKIALELLDKGVSEAELNIVFKKPMLRNWADAWKDQTYDN